MEMTPKRAEILEAIEALGGRTTVAELCESVKDRVGQTTVYSRIYELDKMGMVKVTRRKMKNGGLLVELTLKGTAELGKKSEETKEGLLYKWSIVFEDGTMDEGWVSATSIGKVVETKLGEYTDEDVLGVFAIKEKVEKI